MALTAGAFIPPAHAQQDLDFSISPSPVGSGARAAGMADAFVAIADDATGASWNPAGLVQLERAELSVVGSFNAITEQFEAANRPEFDSRHEESSTDLHFLSFAYPLPILIVGRNATVSVSYQRKYDFARSFDVDYDLSFIAGDGTSVTQIRHYDFDQDGGLSTITPAFALEITKRLSVGVAFNLWRSTFLSENDWERRLVIRNEASTGDFIFPPTTRLVEEKYDDFEGENYVIGVLWNVTERFNIGMRYDSAFTGKVDYTMRGTGTNLTPKFEQERRKISVPDSLTVGASYRINDQLTLAFDVTRTDWNDFFVKDAKGKKVSLVTGQDIDAPNATELDATYTVRLGSEYVFVPKRPKETLTQLWTVRGGAFYDEEPASNRPTGDPDAIGDGRPDRFWGITAGVGVQAFQRINIDFAYQARFGFGVDSDRIIGIEGFEEDVLQHRFLLSTVIYF